MNIIDLRLQTRLMQQMEIEVMDSCLGYHDEGLEYLQIAIIVSMVLNKVMVKAGAEIHLEKK